MKIKTNELKDGILDWAVDKALNLNTPYSSWGQKGKVPPYSTDWAHGGPITDQEDIYFLPRRRTKDPIEVREAIKPIEGEQAAYHSTGPTRLIAAMRVYVESRLGDEVDVPDDVLKGAELDALIYDRGDE